MKKSEPKPELKICLAIDDYKLKNKDDWWKKMLKKTPWIEQEYDLIKEEIGPGLSKNTVHCYRFYKLKTK